MLSQEDIAAQLSLLQQHRRTLAVYLEQRAALSTAFMPPGVANGIFESRAHIRWIKKHLRDSSIEVQDHPNDEDPPDRAVGISSQDTHSSTLECAIALVDALSLLDNKLQLLFGDIRIKAYRLSQLSSKERYQIVITMNEFAREEKLLRVVRENRECLESLKASPITGEPLVIIDKILSCTNKILDALGYTGVTPFGTPDALYSFLNKIDAQNISSEQQQILQEECDNILHSYDRSLVSVCQSSLGKLKVLLHHQ